MKQSLLLGMILGLCLMACQKKDPPVNLANDAVFSMWTACGWCYGVDSIRITEALSSFGTIRPCDSTDVFYEVNTSAQDYASLITLFDQEAFETIIEKTGNLAADGCDQWVRVEKDGKDHTIWFESVMEDRLLPVRDFLVRLESIKQEME